MVSKKRIQDVYYELAAIQSIKLGDGLPDVGKENTALSLWKALQQILFAGFLTDAGLEVTYIPIQNYLVQSWQVLTTPGSFQKLLTEVLDLLIQVYVSASGVVFPDLNTAQDCFDSMQFLFFDTDPDSVQQHIQSIARQYEGKTQSQQVDLFIQRNQPLIQSAKRFGYC